MADATNQNPTSQTELEAEKQINQELGLVMPKKVEPTEIPIWEEYFSMLRTLYLAKLVLKADIRDLLLSFYKVPSEKKVEKLNEMKKYVFEQLQVFDLLDSIYILRETDSDLRKIANLLPAEKRVEFIYQVLNYNPDEDPDLIELLKEDAVLGLTTEEIELLQQQNLTKTIEDIRRKPLDVRKLASSNNQFNRPLSAEQISTFVDEGLDESESQYAERQVSPQVPERRREQPSAQTNPRVQSQAPAPQTRPNPVIAPPPSQQRKFPKAKPASNLDDLLGPKK